MESEIFINTLKWFNNIIKLNSLKETVCAKDYYIITIQCNENDCILIKEKGVKSCKNKRFETVLLRIETHYSNNSVRLHRNSIIIDNELKTFERFEPNDTLDVQFRKLFNRLYIY
jgi:hypothetical protein